MSFADSPSQRSLTVASTSGLANRLRVLLSARALADVTGREFSMLWPRTRACAASFGELFENPWNVVEAPLDTVRGLPRYGGHGDRPLPDLAAKGAELPPFIAVDWLVPRDRSWRTRVTRNGSFGQVSELQLAALRRTEELAGELRPVAEVAARIDAFGATQFRPTMIGVHLRRGDFNVLRPDVANNTDVVLAQVDSWLSAAPEAGILLCTDDGATDHDTGSPTPPEGVRARFIERYPDRVVTTEPRSLDRREPVCVQDALVDLFLLRRVDYFAGTKGSSYSELAVFGREVPQALLGMGRGRDRWMRYSGVEAAIVGAGWLSFGSIMPAPAVLRRLRKALPTTSRRRRR